MCFQLNHGYRIIENHAKAFIHRQKNTTNHNNYKPRSALLHTQSRCLIPRQYRNFNNMSNSEPITHILHGIRPQIAALHAGKSGLVCEFVQSDCLLAPQFACLSALFFAFVKLCLINALSMLVTLFFFL